MNMNAFSKNNATPGHELCTSGWGGAIVVETFDVGSEATFCGEDTYIANKIQHDAITEAKPNTNPKNNHSFAPLDPKQPPS